MNRKGFTLIELLAVIILIALIAVLIVPNIIDTMTKSKEASYQLLVKNIVTASKSYYEECEYGNLSNEKYGSYACIMNNNTITITLGTLANTGFLSVKDVDSNNKKKVLNPKNNYDAILISEFETMEDLEKYKNNPEHVKVSALCKQIRIDRQAIDYEF